MKSLIWLPRFLRLLIPRSGRREPPHLVVDNATISLPISHAGKSKGHGGDVDKGQKATSLEMGLYNTILLGLQNPGCKAQSSLARSTKAPSSILNQIRTSEILETFSPLASTANPVLGDSSLNYLGPSSLVNQRYKGLHGSSYLYSGLILVRQTLIPYRARAFLLHR